MTMQLQVLPETLDCEECGGIGWFKSGTRSQLCSGCHGSGHGSAAHA